METWKPLPSYEGIYEVSIAGNIRRSILDTPHDGTYPGKELKGTLIRGYVKVMLAKNGERKLRFLHRLIAETFLPRKIGKDQVNHRNGRKTDNSVRNLEWCTSKENTHHAMKSGLRTVYGIHHHLAKLTNEDVKKIRKLLATRTFEQQDIARAFGVTAPVISAIYRRKTWKHIV